MHLQEHKRMYDMHAFEGLHVLATLCEHLVVMIGHGKSCRVV
jgi:hypothetical protein